MPDKYSLVINSDFAFASELRRLRRSRGLSQVVLAQRAQVSERAVRYWEAGTTFPGAWEIQSLLTALAPEPSERVYLVSLLPNRRGTQIARQESAQVEGGVLSNPPALGDLIRAMRLRRGFTQRHAADQMRVTQSTLLRWESAGFLPSEDNLERLCVLYNAHPEEQSVLRSRRLQLPGSAPLRVSLEECEEKVARLTDAISWPISPLIDLYALLLKRELWPLAARSEDALLLLVTVQTWHGYYLFGQDRVKEAVACVNHGLTLFQGRPGVHPVWRKLINIAAPYVGTGRTKQERALHLTKKWLPSFSDTLRAPLWCDVAVYSSHAGQHEYAAYCLKQARKTLPLSLDAAYMSEHYFPFSKAKTLLYAKSPWEAINWLARLPAPKNSAGLQALQQLYWIEALINAGETSRAQTLLDTLSGLLAQFPQPYYEERFAALAARI